MEERDVFIAAAIGGVVLAAAVVRLSPKYNPPPAKSEGERELRAYLERIRETGALPGFEVFAHAVAKRESGFNNMARNTTASEASSAARLFEGAKSRGHFSENPFVGDEQDWVFGSGGWFGFLPSTALSQGGRNGPWQNEHPSQIFNPAQSVAMAASYAAALIKHYFDDLPPQHRNFLALRRGWKALSLIPDYNETQAASRGVHERLVLDLQRVTGWTKAEAEAFAHSPATLGNWRGASWISDLMRGGVRA